MSQTLTELLIKIPSGTLTDKLVSFSRVKDALIDPKRTTLKLDKLEPVSEIVLFCGALAGVKVDKLKVVFVKLAA